MVFVLTRLLKCIRDSALGLPKRLPGFPINIRSTETHVLELDVVQRQKLGTLTKTHPPIPNQSGDAIDIAEGHYTRS